MAPERCWIAVAVAFTLLVMVTAVSLPLAKRQQYDLSKQLCGTIFRSSEEAMERYYRSDYPEDEETACFVRCYGILTGTYDDRTGIKIEELYERFGEGLTLEQYVEESKPCLALWGDIECYCMKALKPSICLIERYRNRKAL